MPLTIEQIKERRKIYDARYKLRHPEAHRLSCERYKKNNPEKVRESSQRYYFKNRVLKDKKPLKYGMKRNDPDYERNWRIKNLPRWKEISVGWQKRNPDKYRLILRINQQRRRAVGVLNSKILQSIYDENKIGNGFLKCYLCLSEIKSDWTIDHIVPVSKGGTNDKANLKIAHRSCNSRKFNKSLEDFLVNAAN